jgi:hypothetical protein
MYLIILKEEKYILQYYDNSFSFPNLNTFSW